MKIAYFLLAAAVFSACSATNHVYISVLEPAPVNIPHDVKTVAVINRTAVSSQNKIIDAIDKVITLEGPELDKAGAEASVAGLTDELSRNNRFTAIKFPTDAYISNSAPGLFPTPLSWREVAQICNENHADAVFALELFDTDSKINYAANQSTLSTPFGVVPSLEHQANMQTLVKTGWRIYDLRDKMVLDEYSFARSLNYSSKGVNPIAAAAGLINRKDAVKEAGSQNGHVYAQRILPYWIRVYRDYYIKGNDNFSTACRMTRTGNWKDAATLWLKETTNPDKKMAGHACYNMAIISEINGDIEKGIEWARKAYEQYKNALALSYVNILSNRRTNNLILEDQQQ